jgi:hypothetical protein
MLEPEQATAAAYVEAAKEVVSHSA